MTIYAVGVDPGAKESGVVCRRGNELLDHVTVRNLAYPAIPDAYLDDVKNAIVTARIEGERRVGGFPPVAVEAVEPPNPHMGMISVVAILGTATVLGAVRAWYPGAVVVDPGKNGSLPLACYPDDLIGPRERGVFGKGGLRHARSAWDIAGKAHLYAGRPQ